ncbi:MAG: DsbA family protein [Anaerolineales bacterium]|nr:DsbA family protein [Anaerolineales bacterium]
MPKKRKDFTRQRISSMNVQRNLMIAIGAVVLIVAVVAIIASQSAPVDASFPAREIGNRSTARVLVEEYSDYQCPTCGLFATTAEIRLREEYINTGKVLFIYRSLPVLGAESTLAALGALCAGDQDMFWEYHDILYRNQAGVNLGSFTTARLQAFAVELNLDSLAFNKCLSSQSRMNVLEADVNRANVLRIQDMPTFYVNNVMVAGSDPSFQWLFDAIDRALLSAGG